MLIKVTDLITVERLRQNTVSNLALPEKNINFASYRAGTRHLKKVTSFKFNGYIQLFLKL